MKFGDKIEVVNGYWWLFTVGSKVRGQERGEGKRKKRGVRLCHGNREQFFTSYY